MSNSIWSLKGLFASPRYEIGDIYLTTRVGNPNTLLGYGTWELIPGKTLVCVDTSDSDFNIVKKTGGEKEVTLTIDKIPGHQHGEYIEYGGGKQPYTLASGGGTSKNGYFFDAHSTAYSGPQVLTEKTGGSQPHNNLQPYFTCYIWIRTA